jgi:hypothetical protein
VIKVGSGVVAIKVDPEVYAPDALEAAAARFVHAAKINIDGGNISLKPKDAKADLEGLALEFLNEALSHQYRLFVQTMNMPALAPVMQAAKNNGFAEPPGDWVKEREPQVTKDREREIRQLMDKAKRRGAT